MTEAELDRKTMLDGMRTMAWRNRLLAEQLKEIADDMVNSRDARTIYNTLGPLDAVAESLERAVGRLEG